MGREHGAGLLRTRVRAPGEYTPGTAEGGKRALRVGYAKMAEVPVKAGYYKIAGYALRVGHEKMAGHPVKAGYYKIAGYALRVGMKRWQDTPCKRDTTRGHVAGLPRTRIRVPGEYTPGTT